MLVFAKTHIGLVRKSNQDSLLIAHGLYGVADGMGGHKGGETASRIAVQVLTNALGGKRPLENALAVGVEAANRRIYEMQRHDSSLSGMGTTLTVLWEDEKDMLIAHVGDSRAYLLRDGELTQQTQDHSVVAELLRNKVITPEMAVNHPYKSVITRALGTDPVVKPDLLRVEKRLGDLWLVCSDGLYNMVPDEHLLEVLTALPPEKAAEKLLELAIEHGGQDNVSFVLGKVTEVSAS